MKKILITGSNGLLGQTLTGLALTSKIPGFVATSKGDNRFPSGEGYNYISVDVTDHDKTERIIRLVRPDVVINTAAMTMVDQCEESRQHCRALNVDAVQNLVNICTAGNIHLIHLSTDFIFDGENGPYKEEDLPNPLSYYGLSKLEAEKIVQQSTCKWTILRTVLVYGVTACMSRSNIVLWVKASLEKGAPIRVVSDQWRTPTLVDDLARACLHVANAEKTGVYHISGSEMMSIAQIAEQVADFWKLNKSTMTFIESKMLNETKRPRKTGFIISKAVKELGYIPHTFKEGLQVINGKLVTAKV